METTALLSFQPRRMGNTQTFKAEELTTSTEYVDWLFRINQNPEKPATYHIAFEETAVFVSNLQKLFQGIIQENTVLKTLLKSLWKNYQYQQEYTSFLLGNYSKEEFLEIARKYAEPFHETTDKDYFLFAGQVATSALQQSLNSYDLSLLLSVDCSWIEQNLQLTKYSTNF
jgi:hypothetical protein